MLITGKGRKEINLAGGVTFNEAKHEYYRNGKTLSGVTGRICRRMNLEYGGSLAGEACASGSHIHAKVQEWINSSVLNSVHPDVVWIAKALENKYKGEERYTAYSEVLVTDGMGIASAIDVLVVRPDGKLDLFDIKTGSVKPEYLAWQLGVYSYFCLLENKEVNRCFCLASKDHLVYNIKARSVEDVKNLLYC